MQNVFRWSLAALMALSLAVPAGAAPTVLATIKPVHSLVAAVMKGAGEPELLISGAASAHSYTLKPSDARKIAGADILFEVGPIMETWLVRPAKNLARGKVVILSKAPGVKLLPARSGGIWGEDAHGDETDPHIWLNPDNAAAMVRAIRDALIKADPAHAKTYGFNAKMEIARIQDVSMHLGSQLSGVHNKRYIVFHDAYQYFETYYNLHPAGAVTVTPDRPISPRRLMELKQDIAKHHDACLFREPEISPALIKPLQEGTKIRVDVLDPLGADIKPGPQLYLTLMRNIGQSLHRCLLG